MLATVALVLGGFVLVVVRASRARGKERFEPAGKLRWTDEPPA